MNKRDEAWACLDCMGNVNYNISANVPNIPKMLKVYDYDPLASPNHYPIVILHNPVIRMYVYIYIDIDTYTYVYIYI